MRTTWQGKSLYCINYWRLNVVHAGLMEPSRDESSLAYEQSLDGVERVAARHFAMLVGVPVEQWASITQQERDRWIMASNYALEVV